MNQPYSYKNNKKSIKCKDEININNCNKKPSIKPYPCTCFGVIGATGLTGPAGTSGILGYADFYALMPPDNAAALTITPVSGGTESVSAHLVITQIEQF